MYVWMVFGGATSFATPRNQLLNKNTNNNNNKNHVKDANDAFKNKSNQMCAAIASHLIDNSII